MPPAKIWSEEADLVIKQMRGAGQTWSAIGMCLGLSRNTVIERGRRLCALAPKRDVSVAIVKVVSDDPNRGALPAGHPLTWGLLSDQAFPEPCCVHHDIIVRQRVVTVAAAIDEENRHGSADFGARYQL